MNKSRECVDSEVFGRVKASSVAIQSRRQGQG